MDVVNLPEKAYIYGLFDPRFPDVIWYVGKTNNPRVRLHYYRRDNCSSPVYKWFHRLQAEGFEPKLRILRECPFSEWKECETTTISLYRKKNLLLLNKLNGGNGTAVKGRKEFCDTCGTKRKRLFPSDEALRCPVCRPKQRRVYESQWAQENKTHLTQYKAGWYLENQERLIAKSSERYRNWKLDKIPTLL